LDFTPWAFEADEQGVEMRVLSIRQTNIAEPLITTSYTTGGPAFLPDASDGSLYYYDQNVLQKMPAGIKDLVGSSPFRGSDGIVYIGVCCADHTPIPYTVRRGAQCMLAVYW
jgi:hypothetical protein